MNTGESLHKDNCATKIKLMPRNVYPIFPLVAMVTNKTEVQVKIPTAFIARLYW